jgi:2-phosphosulfolactate phosphatase
MDITFCTLDDVATQTGCVVVIDVLRAFTTAAVALAAGAGPYELVGTLQQAYDRKSSDPRVQLLGEVDGITAVGFDHGNSPTAIWGKTLRGIPLAHRSSAGTQGVVRARSASLVLTTSFAVAGATAVALADQTKICFCVTGADDSRDGDEDRACGEYLAALLTSAAAVDPTPYVDRVARSTAGQRFLSDDRPDLPAADVSFAQVVDRFDFAMIVRREDDRHWLEKRTVTWTPPPPTASNDASWTPSLRTNASSS